MNRKVVKTRDNSSTLFVPELDEHYHSIHGALQESQHVFIQEGLHQLINNKVTLQILEVGFGTGLNAVLTAIEAERHQVKIAYTSLEKYPISAEEMRQLNYAEMLKEANARKLFHDLHEVKWEEWISISEHFNLFKHQADLKNFSGETYDLIYFDAFAPSAQPELWSTGIFHSMYRCLKPGGVLVTYCVKGEVRRNMKAAGLEVEKIPGPPGKREMARARKSKVSN